MGLQEGRGQLGKLYKDLQLRWHEARVNWDDDQARRFEARYLEPMERDLRTAISAMDDMAAFISQVRQECE